MATARSALQPTAPKPPASSWWQFAALGAAFILAGFVVLANLVAATVASAILFGIALIVGGVVQVVLAFSAKSWAGSLVSVVTGVFYGLAGAVLLANPLAASVTLTLVFAVFLIGSGIFRIILARRLWRDAGWALLLSGALGVLVGLMIALSWPVSGLWVLGAALGADLLSHGAAWLAYAFMIRRPSGPAVATGVA